MPGEQQLAGDVGASEAGKNEATQETKAFPLLPANNSQGAQPPLPVDVWLHLVKMTPLAEIPRLLNGIDAASQELAVCLVMRFLAQLRKAWGAGSDARVLAPGATTETEQWIPVTTSNFLSRHFAPTQLKSILAFVFAERRPSGPAVLVEARQDQYYVRWMAQLLGVHLDCNECCCGEHQRAGVAVRPEFPGLQFVCPLDKALYAAITHNHQGCTSTLVAQLTSAVIDGSCARQVQHLWLPPSVVGVTNVNCMPLLRTVDLSCCASMTQITNTFGHQCPKLTSVTIPKSITSIGDDFLSTCNGLKKIDLHACTSLTQIGHRFADRCPMLTSVKVPNSITSIGDDFLSTCNELEKIDLHACTSLTQIGHRFADKCPMLTSVKVPTSITSIGDCFRATTALRAIFEHCPTLQQIGQMFAYRCPLLSIHPHWASITSIDDLCLFNCATLTTIDLSACAALTRIAPHFAQQCPMLTDIKLPNSITSIGDGFCAGSTAMTAIDLSPLRALQQIGDMFGYRCSHLTSVKFWKSITSIGDCFLANCDALTTIDLSPCTSLTQIGHGFADKCPMLTSVNVPNSITSIGDDFLSTCNASGASVPGNVPS